MPSIPIDKGKFKHWAWQENLNYFFFLTLHLDRLNRNKKQSKIYVLMSKYLGKTSTQCRTHHQKRIKEVRASSDKEPQLENIYIFYQQNYKQRLLDCSHLKLQLKNFVKVKQKEGKICQMDLNKHIAFINDIEQYLSFCFEDRPQDEESQKGETRMEEKIQRKEDQRLHDLKRFANVQPIKNEMFFEDFSQFGSFEDQFDQGFN